VTGWPLSLPCETQGFLRRAESSNATRTIRRTATSGNATPAAVGSHVQTIARDSQSRCPASIATPRASFQKQPAPYRQRSAGSVAAGIHAVADRPEKTDRDYRQRGREKSESQNSLILYGPILPEDSLIQCGRPYKTIWGCYSSVTRRYRNASEVNRETSISFMLPSLSR